MSKKEHQPGFIYIKSETLNQEIALSEKSGWVFCEDGTKYSPGEIKTLDAGGNGVITLGVHNVKKVFGGEVIKIERDIRGNGQAKPVESGTGNSIPDNTNPGTKIPETTGNSPAVRPGELDIY
jgi:hypothetical protein